MKGKKILVLNLTRMGDLIQTTPLIAGLKDADPSCEVTLAVNVGFVGITDFLPDVDRVIPFDITPLRPANPSEYSVLDAFRRADSFVKELKAGGFDVLINLTHSTPSGIIGNMLGIPDVRGICLSDDAARTVHNRWLMYFSTLLSFRHYNTFNLVDVYVLGGGAKPGARRPVLDTARPELEARALLAELGITEGEKIIGLQAGSSMAERRWPPSNFARTADLLAERWNARIVFFGVHSEKELVDEVISKMKNGAINLAGRTSVSELVGIVKRCFLLLTNDTATMHVAAAVGVPIVALFLVHAYGAETGPYCENAVVLEPAVACFPCLHQSKCPHYACLAYISPEHAAEAAEIAVALKNGEAPKSDPAKFESSFGDSSRRVRISKTVFDEHGFYDLRPVFKKPAAEQDVLARMYRLEFMRPVVGKCPPDGFKRYLTETHVPPSAGEAAALAARKRPVFDKLAQTAKKGAEIIARARHDHKNGKLDKMKKYADELANTDRSMELHAMSHPELMPIVRMFQVGRGNMAQAPVEAMLERAKLLYAEAEQTATAMVDLLDELAAG